MKTVRQLLAAKNSRIISVHPEESVLDALKVMAENNIGAVLVLEEDMLAGIFTERDYARKVALQGKTSSDTRVREIMTSKVFYVSPDRTTEESMALMTEKRCRHLPVLDADNKVLGIVSIGDLVKEALDQQRFIIEQLESYIAH